MKFAAQMITVFLLGSVSLWAQNAPQTPPPTSQPPMHHPDHDHMMGMHHDMMHMQEQVKNMRATLEKMKANLAKITDPALKQQAQYDVDLWEAMVEHMEGMSKMMSGTGMPHEWHGDQPKDHDMQNMSHP